MFSVEQSGRTSGKEQQTENISENNPNMNPLCIKSSDWQIIWLDFM